MGVTAAISAVGLVSNVVSGNKQRKEQKKAAAEQKKANRVSRRMEEVQANRAKRQQLAQARVRQAQLQAGAFEGGAQGSSALAGAQGGISSTVAGNMGFSTQMQGMANQASIFNQNAADAATAANIAGQQASMGASIFNFGVSQGGAQGLFGNNNSTTG